MNHLLESTWMEMWFDLQVQGQRFGRWSESNYTKQWCLKVPRTSSQFQEQTLQTQACLEVWRWPRSHTQSRFVWSQRKAGKEDPRLEWSDDGRAPHYRSGSRVCGLCNLETYKIAICPESMRLNPHSELLKKCIHKHYVELRNVGKPGLIDDRRPP